jgi:uncharacterized protein (DUF342 family)
LAALPPFPADTEGSITINGAVNDNFEVRARGDIEGTVREGVEICFGTRRLHIESDLGPTRFEFDEESRSISTSELQS